MSKFAQAATNQRFVQEVGDTMHAANVSTFHRDGFCLACGELYAALQEFLGKQHVAHAVGDPPEPLEILFDPAGVDGSVMGESATAGRVGETWLATLPCPECKQMTVIGYLFVNEFGEHMHTHYVCTYWPTSRDLPLGAPIRRQCGWHGWSVPGWDQEEAP